MTTAELRLDGYRSAMRRHGLPVEAEMIRNANNTEADGDRAVEELLKSGPSVTAIVSMTDNIAVGAYRAARRCGLKLPEDLSVVGFDDVPIVGDLTPALSTVHPPFFEVGMKAAEIGLGLVPASNVLLPTRFINRASIASLAR